MCDPKTADQLEVAVQKKFPEEHMKKNVAAMCNEYLKFLTETFKLDRKSLWFTSGATLGAAFFLLYNWCTGAVSTSTITGFAFAAVQLQGTICSLIANGTTIHEAAMKVNKSLRLVENWKEVSNNYGLAPRSFTPEEVADWKNRLKGKKIDFILSDIVVSSPEDPKNTILQINGSLTIQAGSLVGIVGESGAGKTTFVNVLLGILKPTSGDVRIALSESRGQSYSLSEIPLEALHNEIGYNEQGGYAGRGVTVDKYVGLGANDHDDSRKLTVAEALEQANVTFLNGKEPADVTIGLGGREFSGGEQSRLRVAQVLYGNRPIFILDEPHTGLDNFNKQSILDNIFKENRTRKTRLYISHDLSGFDRCDQIIVIQGGKPVLSGTPEEMKLKSTHYQELIESANKYPVPSILKTAPRDPLCQLVLPGFDC
jgi:ABC-type multidrug transport system fused ATPase/permease subunit